MKAFTKMALQNRRQSCDRFGRAAFGHKVGGEGAVLALAERQRDGEVHA
ncbi:hypothetical protein [Deinococcus hopiensis]|nr:hypothetical protein [Deinococcus hopiensis]